MTSTFSLCSSLTAAEISRLGTSRTYFSCSSGKSVIVIRQAEATSPAGSCGYTITLMGPEGSEHPPCTQPKTPISETVRTQSGTLDAEKPPADPDLALIQDRWATLPEHIKAAIMALVQSASKQD